MWREFFTFDRGRRAWPIHAFALTCTIALAVTAAVFASAGARAGEATRTTTATRSVTQNSTPRDASAQREPQLELGRSLFEQGRGRDGREIGARMGASEGVGLRGGAVACANCHGRDGRGGGEGWVRAPDLRWFALGRPNLRANGAQRPAYDLVSLTRALRGGIGADATPLDSTMPRYDLADDEIAALLAYLHRLDGEETSASHRPALLVLMPERADGPAERLLEGWRNCPLPAAMRGHKRPALRVLRYARMLDALRDVASQERDGSVAALFAPYLIGAEPDFSHAALPADLPVLLPISLRGVDPAGAPVLFGLPSQRLQALALARDTAAGGAWSLYRAPDDALAGAHAQALVAELAGQGIAAREVETIDAATASPVLVLSPLPMPPSTGAGPVANPLDLRIPVANLGLAAAQAWHERGARIRLAFAYPPRPAAAPSRWIGPEQAWTALGCELLARLPPVPASAAELPAWRSEVAALAPLNLSGWFQLPARSDHESAIGRIELRDWPESAPAPASTAH